MPTNAPLNRKLRMGLIGGGQGAFIGRVHATAAVLDNRAALVAACCLPAPDLLPKFLAAVRDKRRSSAGVAQLAIACYGRERSRRDGWACDAVRNAASPG